MKFDKKDIEYSKKLYDIDIQELTENMDFMLQDEILEIKNLYYNKEITKREYIGMLCFRSLKQHAESLEFFAESTENLYLTYERKISELKEENKNLLLEKISLLAGEF